MTVQYLTDEQGLKTAVVVPIDDWTRLTAKLEKLRKKELFFQDLKDSFLEVEAFKAGVTQLETVETLFE